MPALPSLVFEHFRAPRHQGPLEAAAYAELEGRREDAWVRLYLREEPDGTLRAGYELEGDRSPVAALSLLATWLHGRPRAAAEALTLEDLAAHYELPFDLWPSLVLPLDALTAALAALRGRPSPFADEGELVCHCLHVREQRLRRAIRERGLRTVEEVRFWTRACSGCRSCRDEVAGLLADEAPG
ncbi:MAG: (2Fe-2S)-binding protein [Planctomycetota bacterium]